MPAHPEGLHWRRDDPAVAEGLLDGNDARDTPGDPAPLRAAMAADLLPMVRARAWSGIEGHARKIGAFEFQHLVAALLRAMGWQVNYEAAPGPDGGVDIVACRDALGTMPPRLKVQVKHWDSKTGAAALRGFAALLREGDVGLFVRPAASPVTRRHSPGCTPIA